MISMFHLNHNKRTPRVSHGLIQLLKTSSTLEKIHHVPSIFQLKTLCLIMWLYVLQHFLDHLNMHLSPVAE
ncbi:UNVERIFIED_CONTAM: hypothetical protein NCL1_52044 [Trichonephila clavipes]